MKYWVLYFTANHQKNNLLPRISIASSISIRDSYTMFWRS